MDWIQWMGIVSSIALPLFNIPLIIKLIKKKNSGDLSLTWALGVWICIVLMTPQALVSKDFAFKAFGIMNIIFFTIVAFFVVKYRPKA